MAGRRGQVAEARSLLERVAQEGPLSFRARAMMSLGSYSYKLEECGLGLPFFIEAGRAAQHVKRLDPYLTYCVPRMTAVLKGQDGDHKRSLDDLEKIFPLARMVGREYPALLHDYLNSYAVELAAVGRIEEAGNVSRIVLASPYANAYPEWRETADDIAGRGLRPSRSRVAFNQQNAQPCEVVRLRVRQSNAWSVAPYIGLPSAEVYDFFEWKKKMGKDDFDDSEGSHPELTAKQKKLEKLRRMTSKERLMRVMLLLGDPDVTDEQIYYILSVLEGLDR